MRIIGHGVDIQDIRRVERHLSNPHNEPRGQAPFP